VNGVAKITTIDLGQTDAALVRRFRQAVTKRARAAAFDRVVRTHRDAVLGRCAERLWPDADAAVAAAHDVFIIAYQAMADPAKLGHPDRLRDWLLAIEAHGELTSRLPAGIDAINWVALQASITASGPETPGSAERRAWLRNWLEQIVATLPETRQHMYDLFVLRALDSRNVAMELGTGIPEARRARRENREAILRAFEVTALAAAEAALDPRYDDTAGCAQLRQILTDGLRDGDTYEGLRRDSLVLLADLRLSVTRHVNDCDTCYYRRDDCIAQWAPELLALLAGAELNEQVIEDLRTMPESGRSHAGAFSGGHYRGGRDPERGLASAGAGKAIRTRRAAVAGVGLLAALLLLGFVEPGFLLSATNSVPRGSSSSSAGPGSAGSSVGPAQRGTSAGASGRPVPSTSGGSSPGQPANGGGGSTVAPTSSSGTPTQRGTGQPSSSTTLPPSGRPIPTPNPVRSSTPEPTPEPTTAPPTTPAPTTPAPTTQAPTTPPGSPDA